MDSITPFKSQLKELVPQLYI